MTIEAIYFVFRLSGLLSALAVTATIVLTDVWDAVAAAVAIAGGMVFALSFIALVTVGDGTSRPSGA
jgi:FtsH-binding integral membrane protein